MDKEGMEELKEIASADDTEHETEESDVDNDSVKLTDNKENESDFNVTSDQGFRTHQNAWKARARKLAAKLPHPGININKQLVLTKIFYFFFFAAVGSLLPFLGVYYKQLWLSAKQVGILIGVRPTVKLLCSPLWGMVSDTYNKPKMVLLVATLGWLIGYYGQSFVSPTNMPCYSNTTLYGNFTTAEQANPVPPLINKRNFKIKDMLRIPNDVGQTQKSNDANEINNLQPHEVRSRERRNVLFMDDFEWGDYHNPENRIAQNNPRLYNMKNTRSHNEKPSPFKRTKDKDNDIKKGLSSDLADEIHGRPVDTVPSMLDVFVNDHQSLMERKDEENTLNEMIAAERKRQAEIDNILRKKIHEVDASNEQWLSRGKPLLPNPLMQDAKLIRNNPDGSSQHAQLPSKDFKSDESTKKSFESDSEHREKQLLKRSKVEQNSDQIRALYEDYPEVHKDSESRVENERKGDEIEQRSQDAGKNSETDESLGFQAEDNQSEGNASYESKTSINDAGLQYDALTQVSVFTGPKIASPHPPEDYRVQYNKQIFLVLLTIIILSEILATPAPMVVDSGTLQLLEMYGKRTDYGKQRLFGSFGWILGAIIAGGIVTSNITCNFTDTVSYESCFHVFAAFMTVTFIVASFFEFETAPKLEYDVNRQTLWEALKSFGNFQGGGFLLTVFFCGFWHSTFMSFLFWFLQDIEGTPIIYALVLVLNSLTEVVVFFTSDFIIEWWSNVGMIYMGLICYCVRFLFYTYLERPWLVLPMEVLQGFTFGGIWTAAMNYVNTKKGANASHQSLLHGVYWGLGMAAGGIVSGVMIDFVGTRLTFLVNAISVVVILGVFWLTNKNNQSSSIPSTPPEDQVFDKRRSLRKTSSKNSVGPLGPLVPSLLYGKHFV